MPIVTYKEQRRSYLYLLGVRPERPIRLSEHCVLEPVSADPSPDDMIKSVMDYGSKSEIDLGILISTLRSVTAQIKVDADDSESLAVHAWNAQTDALLVAALLGCEVYWNIQSNVSVEAFHSAALVHVVQYMTLFPKDVTFPSLEDCKWLEESFDVASALLNNDSFYVAANALWSYRMNPRPSTQLAVLWSGIESIFGIKNELVFRISLLVSRMLGTGSNGQRKVKKLYNARSKAVHEGEVKDGQVVANTARLLHELIMKCVELREVPSEEMLLFG